MGSAWGINRTMAQIHALLMTSDRALTTDEVMEDLKISRGNAHQNLRELVGWGLVRSVIRKGERKEYFESEKDVWRMFCIVARERKRREIEPALKALRACEEQTRACVATRRPPSTSRFAPSPSSSARPTPSSIASPGSKRAPIMPSSLKILGKPKTEINMKKSIQPRNPVKKTSAVLF